MPEKQSSTVSKPIHANREFGKALAQIREGTGLTRQDVVARVAKAGGNLPYTTLASIETGDRAITERSAERIGFGLGVLPADLIALSRSYRAGDEEARILELKQRISEQGIRARRAEEDAVSRSADATGNEPIDIRDPAGAVLPIWMNTGYDESVKARENILLYEDTGWNASNAERIGRVLKEIRTRQGLTADQVALKAGLSSATIDAIENGEWNLKETDDLEAFLAQGLGRTPRVFAEGIAFTDGYGTQFDVRYMPDTSPVDGRYLALTSDERINLGWVVTRAVLGPQESLSAYDAAIVGLLAERVATDDRLRNWLVKNYVSGEDLIELERLTKPRVRSNGTGESR